MAEQMQGSVARDGREIGWRSVGAGAPLLLLNGYGGTAADWDPNFLDALAERFEVVLPDNRGMGASTWGDDAEALTIASMAALESGSNCAVLPPTGCMPLIERPR